MLSLLPSWPKSWGAIGRRHCWSVWLLPCREERHWWTSCPSPRPLDVYWERSVDTKAVQSTFDHLSQSRTSVTNQTFAFHLLGRSANLHSNITSRIANADHHHPFSCEGICIFIFPAVKTPARKGFMPWRNTDFATVTRKTFFPRMSWFKYYYSMISIYLPWKSDNGNVGWV